MKTSESCKACEGILIADKQYNIDNQILPSRNVIIDNLLGRRLELLDAYEELYRKLNSHPNGLRIFFDALLCCAMAWSPKDVAKSRNERTRLDHLNQKIAKAAENLADLLDERDDLHNHSDFYSDAHYHVCEVIEVAAEHNGHFNGWVKEPLAALRGRFDMKYWPSIADFIHVLADDAERARSRPSNTTTAAATTGPRASDTDFFKALFCRLQEETVSNHSFLPTDLRLTDSALGSLTTCALNLPPAKEWDAAYVKRLRQRLKTAAKAEAENVD